MRHALSSVGDVGPGPGDPVMIGPRVSPVERAALLARRADFPLERAATAAGAAWMRQLNEIRNLPEMRFR